MRRATEQLLDEGDRSLHDALSVLSQTVIETRTVLGGGCSKMLMSKAVKNALHNTPGKKVLVIEALARALQQLTTILADHAGLDSTGLVVECGECGRKERRILVFSGARLLT